MEHTVEEALQKGIAAHKEGKLLEAERIYHAILQSQPDHPDANHNLGLLAVSSNKFDNALTFFETALKANKRVEEFWLSYINILIKKKQFDNASQALDQAKKQGMSGERFNQLKAQKEQGRLELEKINYIKAIDLNPEYFEAHYNLGVILQRLNKLEESKASFLQAISLKPDFPEAHNNLGNLLHIQNRLEEAETSFKKAIFFRPNYSEAHYNLGVVLQELDRLEEAVVSYTTSIELKPDFPQAHSNLGNTLQELNRLEEAEISFKQAIALNPQYAEAYNNLGVTLREVGRLEEAEESYNQAITLNPNFTAALMNRWQLLFDKKEFEAALRDLDSCNNETSRACSLETLYALGNIDEIYRRIEMYAELDEDNIRMAAFSSFISECEKKDTAHKFCQNPLSFLYFSNISNHIKDSDNFIKDVIEELSVGQTIWEPYQKTTVKGFQTPSHINIFQYPSGKMNKLKSIILDELDMYYSKFKNESCSYIKNWPSEKNLRGWHVILKKNGCQTSHIHASGWLSGVIYLKVVPSLEKDEGAIEFSLNSDNYSDLNSPKLMHQPELGEIIFFPSSLFHRTIPFSVSEERIIVSFDLKPKKNE